MSVGSNIKKRRYELKMSQQDLADAMGYKTRSTIAKIESGENDVSQKKLQKFASVLDTTVESLIAGYGIPHISLNPSAGDQNSKNHTAAIILAGGKSGRNRQNVPSQFINVQGKPIIVYCMEAYQEHPSVDDIFVVCLNGWESIVKDYAEQFGITKLRGLVPAGSSGILSLKNGLEYIKKLKISYDTIIIQESTRPMVSTEIISKLLQACSEKGSATICHSMNDYVQFYVTDDKTEYVDRNRLIALQSPEAHRFDLMVNVFDEAEQKAHLLTESCCTMLLYNLGYPINFVEGGMNNIKIVREEDLSAFSIMVKK